MTTKRSHSKSRTGCKQCKARRIKCDETPPCCNNCHKRGTVCEYSDYRDAFENIRLLTPASFGTPSSQDSASKRSSSSLSPEIQHSSIRKEPSFSIADLGHMHFWTLHTYQTLPNLPGEQYMAKWQYEVPAIAQANPTLMHAILGTAAAHQHSAISEGEHRPQLLQTARYHYGRALNLAATSIHNQSADGLFCFSILTAILTLYLERQKPPPESNAIGDLVSVMHVLRAAQGTLDSLSPEVQQGSITGTLLSHTWNHNPHTLDYDASIALDQLDAVVARYGSRPATNQEDYNILVESTSKLRYFFSLTSPNPTSWQYLMSWPVRLGPAFCSLLQRYHPIALCILAHWCVSMYNAPVRWFAGDWPRQLMLSIQQKIDNTEWSDGILWPLRETLYQAYP